MSDYYNIIDSAEKRAREEGRLAGIMHGREEGREEGLTLGREEEKLDNAVKLKGLGVSVEVISQATGLAVDVIESL